MFSSRSFLFVSCLFTLSFSLFPNYSLADSENVSVCFNEWPPYAVVNNQGEAEGISVSIIKEAAQRIGVNIDFHERPWKRCLLYVAGGEMNAVMDAAKRPEFIQGPTSFSTYSDTIFVRDDSLVTDYRNIRDGVLGLVEGYEYNDAFMTFIASRAFKLDYALDDPTNIRKLAFGRVNAAVVDKVGGIYLSKQNGLSIHPLFPSLSVDHLYLSFNKNDVAIQKKFDAAISSLIEEGYVDQVYQAAIGHKFSDLYKNETD